MRVAALRSRVSLIQPRTVQERTGDRAPGGRVHFPEPVVERAGLDGVDRLRRPAVEGVVAVGRGDASSVQSRQSVSRVSGVGPDAVTGQIAVVVVAVGCAAPVGQPVVGVVGGTGERRGQVHPRQRAAHGLAASGVVVGVAEVTQRDAIALVEQASCEGSIRCIWCSFGLSLEDWKSPNTRPSRSPAE